MRNPYTILGVSQSADPDAVRRAYKKLAVRFHPDRNSEPDAESRFKEVAEAYAILTNERDRERYARSRRREHAERREQAAQRQAAARQSSAAVAAERAFWDYARQVKQRRAQHSAKRGPYRPNPPSEWDRWPHHLGAVAALALMAAYVWRSASGLPLQPWLSEGHFATHPLTSPIWITLSLALLMVVKPRWFLIPILIDGVRDARLAGWAMILLFPFLSAGGPFWLYH